MPASFFIKPSREGLIVRDPATRLPLAAEGEEKPKSAFWLRRESDQDVVQCDPPGVPAAPAAPAKKATGGDQQ